MKFNTALTTLVSLTTLASALPNTYNFKRQALNGTFANTTSSALNGGAGVGAVNTATSALGAAANSSVPNGGAGVGAVNTGLTTQTVTQTVISTVSQQYTTFPVTNVFTETIVIPAGGAGVAPVATVAPGTGSTGTGSAGTGSSGTGSSGTGSSGTGSSGTGSSGTGSSGTGSSGTGSSGTGSSGTGSSGTGSSGTGSSGTGVVAGQNADGSQCVCSVPAVVATGIYTVTVSNVIDLGTTTLTSVYPTTTLGLMTIQGGSVVGAVATVTQSAVVATNTNAVLSAGQAYQTLVIPASGSQPATTIVLVVTVISNAIAPVVPVTNNGGSGVGAVGLTTTVGPFSNSTATSTALNGGAGVKAQQNTLASASSALAAATSAPAVAVGSAIQAGVSDSSVPATATITSGAPVAATSAPAGTRQVAVGSLGTTPLYDQQAFIDDILGYHNTLRARNSAPAMTWNADLAQVALNNVNANAEDGTFLHTKDMGIDNPYGENIASQYGYNNPEYLVYLWYEENTSYNYSNPVFSESTGHFTQVVWVDSTELGCAYTEANDSEGTYYLACEYSPPGNYAGQFSQNVLPMTGSGQPAAPAMYI